MAEFGQIGVVYHAFHSEPPLAQHRCHKGSDESADVDEDIENLEARVAALLDGIELFALHALLDGVGLHVVVHLTYDGLQVALEQTVTECDEEQCHAGEHQQPRVVASRVHHGDSQQHIAHSHDDKTPLDGALVVLCAVGNGSADKTQHIDAGVEHGVDDTGHALIESEL